MLPEEANAIVEEFKDAVVSSCAIHGASLAGIRKLGQDLLTRPRQSENPDPTISFANGDPNLSSTLHAGRMRVSDFGALAAEGGLAEQRLGHQLIVFVYTIWDATYRPNLARSLSVEPNAIEAQIMGDLRLLRNDIVHNEGIADKSAEATELRWFQRGEAILVRHQHVAELDYKVRSLTFAQGE
jgi:hypothetical protein